VPSREACGSLAETIARYHRRGQKDGDGRRGLFSKCPPRAGRSLFRFFARDARARCWVNVLSVVMKGLVPTPIRVRTLAGDRSTLTSKSSQRFRSCTRRVRSDLWSEHHEWYAVILPECRSVRVAIRRHSWGDWKNFGDTILLFIRDAALHGSRCLICNQLGAHDMGDDNVDLIRSSKRSRDSVRNLEKVWRQRFSPFVQAFEIKTGLVGCSTWEKLREYVVSKNVILLGSIGSIVSSCTCLRHDAEKMSKNYLI